MVSVPSIVEQQHPKAWSITVWILYLLSPIFLFTGIPAVIIAHTRRASLAGTFAHSHMTYARWTFYLTWVPNILLTIIAFEPLVMGYHVGTLYRLHLWFLDHLVLGSITIFAFAMWFLYRVVKGLVLALVSMPIARPHGLF